MTQTLFKTGGAGGGNKYENVKDGFYKGVLKKFEEGPTFNDRETGEPQPKVRWVWDLQTPDGRDLGEEISELTSTATGERSTAAKYFSAHLGRAFDSRVDDVEMTMEACIGKVVNLAVSTKPTGYRKVDVFPGS